MSTTKALGSALEISATISFILQLLLGGSMQQLWGLIRAMQMILLSALVETPIPIHTFLFFQGCMTFAQIDIFDGGVLYEKWFDFQETSTLSGMFEEYGLSNKNFMLLSGSYYPFAAWVVIFYFGRCLINFVCTLCPKFGVVRRVGIHAYEDSYIS